MALVSAITALADPLGSSQFYKSGLRSTGIVQAPPTLGPDGNVWFADNKISSGGIPAIGRIATSGEIKEYVAGTNLSGLNAESSPIALVGGPKGSKYLWFTDQGATPAIGVIDSASPETAKEFGIQESGGNEGSLPTGIVAGPEGNLWFADESESTPAIGRIELSSENEIKAIKEFSTGLNPGSRPQGIVVGADGNLWFTDGSPTNPAIGRINPSTQEIKEFSTGEASLPGGSNAFWGPWGIVAGPDGNVWFTENGSNETNGKAICKITPSGTISCFKEGLIGSSQPNGLAVAGGKLWFTDNSGVNEEQEVKISAESGLGGTYKLSFGGKETGATGSGDISSPTKGKGTIQRYPTAASSNATCARKEGSKELTSCNNTPATNAEVGMTITGTGIPAETSISKVEGTTITISNAASSTGSSTNIKASRVAKVETTEGKFAKGQVITGTGLSGQILSIEEKEGKVVAFGLTAVSSSKDETATEPSVTTSTLTNVSASTGAFSEGEVISGKGIPAGCKIVSINTNLKTLTLSCTPTEAGTGVGLTADLPYNATGPNITAALAKLSTVGTGGATGSGVNTESPIVRAITFGGQLAHADVEQLSCNGAGLTGTSPTCSVSTTAQGVPNAIGCMTTSGKVCGKEVRWPLAALYGGGNGIVEGSDGNLWLSAGIGSSLQFGKFGVGNEFTLTVKKTGTGSGTVTSSPAGINCGSECLAKFEEGTEVTLTAKADEGSEFTGWSGSGCSGTGTCKVTMSEAKSVEANFDLEPPKVTNRRYLTLTASPDPSTGKGNGSVSSKPKGIKCASTCTEAVGWMYKESSVELKAKASTGSTLVSWSGCDSSTNTGLEGTCTVKMTADKEVKVTFGGTSKAFTPAEALTLSKGEGSGFGTVKGAGITCEAECKSTIALYQGPIGGEKPKAGKVVILKQAPAFGSKFIGWTGCSKVLSETECEVKMEAAEEVTAEYEALPNKALTINKAYAKGNGSVASKPKGIKCGTTCTQAVAAMPEGAKVELVAKPTTGTFVEWVGGDCDKSTSATCVVTMNTDETTKAVFSDPGKAIAEAKALTVSKGESSAFGTVKAAGLGCEALCTSTTVLYQGPIGGEKPKAGKVVILKAAPAPGSKAVAWSGCTPLNATECEVKMEGDKEVTATFEELE